jgi:hypothetical protein
VREKHIRQMSALVCFVTLSESKRRDSTRCGLGIVAHLVRLAKQLEIALNISFKDGLLVQSYDDGKTFLPENIDVLVVGSCVHQQGSSSAARKFFELFHPELYGVHTTAWLSSGGDHTGGELVFAVAHKRTHRVAALSEKYRRIWI